MVEAPWPSPPRYVEVDVLRGLAALWVVLSHYLPHWNRFLGTAPIIVPHEWGGFAVKLFFAISGFVIFMTLDRCRSVADFVVLRFSRLFPVYWTTIALATAVSILVFGRTFWPGGLLVNATMLQDFVGFPRLDHVYWSLTVELAFYVIAGSLFALGLHRRTLRFVAAWLVGAIIWVLNVQPIDFEHRHWLALLLALDYSPYFGLGIVFFDATKHGWSAAKAGVIVLAMVTEFLIAGWVGLCVAAIVAVLFVLAIRGNLRFLVSKLTLWLGAISYALYLIHRNLGYESLDWLHKHHVGPAVAVSLTTFGALAIATLVTYGVEKPALLHIRSWYYKWKARRTRSSV
jgi:peptidoglycan/LPS O-acetylase OafA/YrhL